ncbi:hypothetical protein KDD93_03950 [Campylobacter sp. faydin G-24]|uniref:Uncharacterized protein n=1 Tax=Campylobacter anatolicus TaxID=2829105 RepID=A0ABS5HHJ4_9BACT|nr:hypothetical protein [Campylobacter anatolicus]MBR8462155.1 hypothetical protein [Campylobacter anatolicus]MBR8463728.1 hypothetical protein [Campylobacter anatolicus]MBR8464760.1 hypothetical protein [Campylobacter anatolicus]
MKQITLTISSRDYTITLDDDFAPIFERDWQKFMGGRKFIEPKELLNAFIEKCYENYESERVAKEIMQNINHTLK